MKAQLVMVVQSRKKSIYTYFNSLLRDLQQLTIEFEGKYAFRLVKMMKWLKWLGKEEFLHSLLCNVFKNENAFFSYKCLVKAIFPAFQYR